VLQVAALAECLQRILGQTFRLTPLPDHGADVGGECVLQKRFSPNQIAILLRRGKFSTIDQSRLGKQFLCHVHGLNHGLNFPLEIVTLVDHVRDVGLLAGFPLEVANLVKNPKDLIRIDGAEGQVVVGIAAVVKVEAAQHVF